MSGKRVPLFGFASLDGVLLFPESYMFINLIYKFLTAVFASDIENQARIARAVAFSGASQPVNCTLIRAACRITWIGWG